jgi:hypothetical protein
MIVKKIGSAPSKGSVAVFGTHNFMVEKFVANTDGGFGEIEKEAEYS